MRIDSTVRLETRRISAGTLILSVLMEAIHLLGGWWDYTVLPGNLIGAGIAVLNFFLMGLTVQQAVDEDEAGILPHQAVSDAEAFEAICCGGFWGVPVLL